LELEPQLASVGLAWVRARLSPRWGWLVCWDSFSHGSGRGLRSYAATRLTGGGKSDSRSAGRATQSPGSGCQRSSVIL